MAYGTNQEIGQGLAQVFPRGKGQDEFIENFNQQRQYQFQRERQSKLDQEKKNDELYSLIGNELNPRDFNAVVHYKVKKAQQDLAGEIMKNKNLDYGQMYLMAHNKAAELGQLSDSLNRVDQQIALTKKEYEQDKRINSGAIEIAARKKILDQIENGSKLDESVNYFDKILNENPEIGLIDKSDATFTDFLPEEKQPLKMNVRKRNSVGKSMQYSYDFDNYPAYYDVQQKGEFEPPTITTKSELSGIKDASGNELPMLSDGAYKRFSIKPSNVVSLNRRIRRNNPDIDLTSNEAERLRKIEAYKDVEKFKPIPRESRTEQQPIIHISTGGSGNGKMSGVDWVKRAQDAMKGVDNQQKEDVFSELIAGDITNLKSFEDLGGGKVRVTILPKPKFDLQGQIIQKSTDPVPYEFDVNDRNLPYRLQNLYQTVMGGDKKLEQTYFKPNETSGGKQPAAKAEVKRSDIKNLIKGRDYTEAEYEQLLKEKGIKIID